MSEFNEPWKREVREVCQQDYPALVDCNGDEVFDGHAVDMPAAAYASSSHELIDRIAACVNFCREFPTHTLVGRHIKYMTSKEDFADPVFGKECPDGFVACTLIPVRKETPSE